MTLARARSVLASSRVALVLLSILLAGCWLGCTRHASAQVSSVSAPTCASCLAHGAGAAACATCASQSPCRTCAGLSGSAATAASSSVLPFVSADELTSIDFSRYASDDGFVGAVIFDDDHLGGRSAEFADWCSAYHAYDAALPQALRVRRGLDLAAIADLGRSPFEGEIAGAVITRLLATMPREALIQDAARCALGRDPRPSITALPALAMHANVEPATIEERSRIFAHKLLGRALGVLPLPVRP